ncbi:hypothetical protein Pst134EB_004380 [Puccinia striiformis f. sp. tritici]|nr:hypothetical protein Pst134EB_004380 [Puccinia striiformis f. sp. tritici]
MELRITLNESIRDQKRSEKKPELYFILHPNVGLMPIGVEVTTFRESLFVKSSVERLCSPLFIARLNCISGLMAQVANSRVQSASLRIVRHPLPFHKFFRIETSM